MIYSLKGKLVSLFLIITLISIVWCCQQKQSEPAKNILVKIRDKTISVKEFIRRAEYTIRPIYCRGDHNLDKKIILNSLIAEKLMVIEATDSNEFITHGRVQAYLRGIKEQYMRQWLFEREALDKVVPDTAKIKKIFKLAGHKYKVAYFGLPDSDSASLVKKELDSNKKTFDAMSREITGQEKLLRREVEWSPAENDMIIDSLYSRPFKKGEIVGPIKIDDRQFMFLKIEGSTVSPAITEGQVRQRWQDIEEDYSQREALIKYDKFTYEVMKDKKLDFFADSFFKVAELLEPIYVFTKEEKHNHLKNLFWDQKIKERVDYRDFKTRIKDLYKSPLFTIDDKTWTVKDFEDELTAHPLIFRTKNLNKNNFPQQLKLAIVDMIRDHYLSKVAYERGYDKINVIKRNVNMWADNLNYKNYQGELLKELVPDSAADLSKLQIINTYLNSVVDSLQIKYSDEIEIDVDAFNKIKLTRIDMYVIRQNVPFPQLVPMFPQVTTDNKLDYGKKMKTKDYEG